MRLQRDVIRRVEKVGTVSYQSEMVDGKPFGKDFSDVSGPSDNWLICNSKLKPDFEYMGRIYPIEPLVPLRQVRGSPPIAVQDPDPILKDIWVLGSIRYLVLRGAGIDNSSLEYVQKLPELEYLDIGETGVDDDGVATIEKMARLRYILLDGTHISPDGVGRIRRAFPGLLIME